MTSARTHASPATVLAAAFLAAASVALASCATSPVREPKPSPLLPPATGLPSPPPEVAPDLGPFAGATITIPTWGAAANAKCHTGTIHLAAGAFYYVENSGKTQVWISEWVDTDLDHDGDTDLVAVVMCGEGPEAPGRQVVGFRKTGSGLEPMGRLIGTQDGAEMMSLLKVESPGIVSALVSNQFNDGGQGGVPNQRRGYAFRNGAFHQVSGPTAWPTDPPYARLTQTADLTLTKLGTAGYVGVLSVRVANSGTIAVPSASVSMYLPASLRPTGPGWTGCTQAGFPDVTVFKCPIGSINKAGELTVRYDLVATTAPILNADNVVAVGDVPIDILTEGSGDAAIIVHNS